MYQVKRVNRADVGGLTRPVRAGAVPVVEGAAEHGVFSRLQHDVAAHKPPHGAAAVSQQTAERRRPRAVVGNTKQQHAQIQQVALCRVPSPEDTGDGDKFSLSMEQPPLILLLLHILYICVMADVTDDFLTHTV